MTVLFTFWSLCVPFRAILLFFFPFLPPQAIISPRGILRHNPFQACFFHCNTVFVYWFPPSITSFVKKTPTIRNGVSFLMLDLGEFPIAAPAFLRMFRPPFQTSVDSNGHGSRFLRHFQSHYAIFFFAQPSQMWLALAHLSVVYNPSRLLDRFQHSIFSSVLVP